MKIAGFGVEAWLNAHEREATTNISQSSIVALTMAEIAALEDQQAPHDFYVELGAARLDYGWIEGVPRFPELVIQL